jgi:hypothetical protein
MKKKIELRLTGLYMYAAKAARLRSARSWLRHSHAALRHSLPALQNLRFCLFGLPNRHIQPERYAKYGEELSLKLLYAASPLVGIKND